MYNFNLKPDETRDFNLLLYLDPDTPMVDANMNASWKGKITLSTGYKEDSKAIRRITSKDSQGMWGYKDKLTKIVIEDTKSVKTAEDGGKVYGPFDESEYGTKAVESYVVCEVDDANCVGYLQSNGKVIANSDSSWLFGYFSNVTKIDGLENLNTSNVKNMNSMFNGIGLTSIDLSMLDVSHVENMIGILNSCEHLVEANISNWDLSNISGYAGVFGGNPELETINMTNVIFPKNSGGFFSNGVSSVNHIILENFDTSHTTNMASMFFGMSGLTELDLSSFDTSHVTSMNSMFYGCSSLQTLDLSYFNTENVNDMYSIFNNCSNLKTLNLSNWNLSKLKSSTAILNGVSSLENINMTNFVFPEYSGGFFSGLTKLNNINLTNADTSIVTYMGGMFVGCSSLTTLDLSNFDTNNVTGFNQMFQGTSVLQSITFGPKFIHKPEATTSGMFNGCPAPERPSDSSWQDVSF